MTTTLRRVLVGAAAALSTVLVTATDASAVTKLTQAQAESMFRNAGITWSSSGGCTNRNVSTCTSFDQLNLTSAQGAVTLKQASGCALNITGGTETGHASGTYSHWNGYKLDFSHYTCLTNYVHSAFSYIGLRGDGAPQYKSGAGNIYADEGSHWDVTFYNCGGC
ncbi:hypothetical protein [Streptacidiphilus sp. ASG 303]|uniref:hypothetical protein n=1 Tax=Streptomycetaceae TaxID=2062 RepID=UPI001E565ACD|nr:hypothetical protein [Streptacidiphilus sp. ASG 303]MCD0481919.1 hypothetical protein [Streptacidiphilus sp. ASG 303]